MVQCILSRTSNCFHICTGNIIKRSCFWGQPSSRRSSTRHRQRRSRPFFNPGFFSEHNVFIFFEQKTTFSGRASTQATISSCSLASRSLRFPAGRFDDYPSSAKAHLIQRPDAHDLRISLHWHDSMQLHAAHTFHPRLWEYKKDAQSRDFLLLLLQSPLPAFVRLFRKAGCRLFFV